MKIWMTRFLGILLVLVQTSKGHDYHLPPLPGILHGHRSHVPDYLLSHPSHLVYSQDNGFRPLHTGYGHGQAEFMFPNYEYNNYDPRMMPSSHRLYQNVQGAISPEHGYPTQAVHGRRMTRQPYLEQGYGISGNDASREPRGGMPVDQINPNGAQTYDPIYDTGTQSYDVNPPQNYENTIVDTSFQPRMSDNRFGQPRTAGSPRERVQRPRRQRPEAQQEGLDRQGQRDRGGIREGYIGARGGTRGFPYMGGFCGGSPMCRDGGLSAGVANGIGVGSLEEFNRRRRTGENKDLSLYETLIRRRSRRQES
ncbi:uncharacterized protein LOC132744856 [Ruditapes philippinarum]|uniref:uncharacterized protein LOC132744856 n=1 Tax=Ruditapes philippinarum TaxID=129788 RepID=UPI00295B7F31|nr:uncharacterized protein LOC132744856 [Ruditapes philippinarum]